MYRTNLKSALALAMFVVIAIGSADSGKQSTSPSSSTSKGESVESQQRQQPKDVEPAEPKTPTPRTITTSKGSFNLPGNAFLDGRDVDATPPLTIMTINVWDSVPRSRVVCKLEHGTSIQLLDARLLSSENRYYFEVRSGSCTGWVPETFLSTQYEEPIGDRMQLSTPMPPSSGQSSSSAQCTTYLGEAPGGQVMICKSCPNGSGGWCVTCCIGTQCVTKC